jgi:DNA-binding XRE family transcriptional regulator
MKTLKTNDEKSMNTGEVIIKNILRNKLIEYSYDKALSIDAAREQLSEALGVTKNKITYWERNTSQPELADALRIAEFFGLEVSILFITHKI